MPRLLVLLAAAIVLVPPRAASGQDTPRTFIAVDGAWQSVNGEFRDSITFLLNAETGDLNADYDVGTGHAFDAEAGQRLWRGLTAGAAVSYFDKQGRVNVDARLPHPFFFNRPRTVSGEADRIARTEVGVHLLAGWLLPLSSRLELLVSGGPSYIRLRQSLVQEVAFTETFPFNSATFAGVSTKNVKAGAWGLNAGADLTFRWHRLFGVGTRFRFSRASVDLPSQDGEDVAVDAGGLQVMGGLRVRF